MKRHLLRIAERSLVRIVLWTSLGCLALTVGLIMDMGGLQLAPRHVIPLTYPAVSPLPLP